MVSGVTVNLNIDYFHPAPVYVDFFPPPSGQPVAAADDRGTKIRVDVTIVKLTTTLANTLCEVRLSQSLAKSTDSRYEMRLPENC